MVALTATVPSGRSRRVFSLRPSLVCRTRRWFSVQAEAAALARTLKKFHADASRRGREPGERGAGRQKRRTAGVGHVPHKLGLLLGRREGNEAENGDEDAHGGDARRVRRAARGFAGLPSRRRLRLGAVY